MIFASNEQLKQLHLLENEYFKLSNISSASEAFRSKFRGELVKGFLKTPEMVAEAIEKINIKIEELKNTKDNSVKEENNKKLSNGVVVARFSGFDADTGEEIHIGDYIVKTENGWSKIDNAF